MIICIFGGSCVGKSTASQALAGKLSLPLRACGLEVKAKAKLLGRNLEDLPDPVHQEVDRETVEWVLRSKVCLVEGRFLDQVLTSTEAPIFPVRLIADAEIRLVRACGRGGDIVTMEQQRQSDQTDVDFRRRMYGGRDAIPPSLTIDTSNLTVEECVDQLKLAISKRQSRI